VVAVVGGLAVAALKGTKWASYVRSEVKSWRDAAEDSVPPEKEIARLRGEVKMLDEDTIKIVTQLARLQSDQADLASRPETIDGLEEEVQALKLAQMESKYQTDDTRVAHIKEAIAKQKKRLDVQRRELALLQDVMVPATTTPSESVDEIMAPLNGAKGGKADT